MIKTKRIKAYWIKERYNPQLGTYFVPMGQLWKKEAEEYEDSLYGSNVMHRYDTEVEYTARIKELKKLGKKVQ